MQRFKCEETSHRMTDDGYLLHICIAPNRVEQLLDSVARVGCAFKIILVGAQPHDAARRPGEQDRNSGRFGIMNNLRKPIDSLVEPVIEAVNKDKHLAASSLFGGCRQSGDKGLLIEIVRRSGHKTLPRIAWQRGGPLHLANLSR